MAMEPALEILLLWLAFAGTHIGLATRRLRAGIVAHLGEWGFRAVFSLVASIAFAALVWRYSALRFAGAPGLALGSSSLARLLLIAIVCFGFVLAFTALYGYPASPYARDDARACEPRGVARITRHPFFVGLAIAGTAHALLSTRLVGFVFFSFLAAYALTGAWHQDRKLLALRGKPYADFMARSSVTPFAAIASGRQRLAWQEMPWGALAASAVAVVLLRWLHDSILSSGGAWVTLAVAGGGAFFLVQSWRRERRRERAAEPEPSAVR